MRSTTSQPIDRTSQVPGGQAPGSRARGRRARRSSGLAVAYLLAAATAAALVVDAVVHLKDAFFYDANTGALLSQGQLFRIQAGVAIVAALAVLALPRKWPVWLFAALVAGSAAAAVVAYTYIDIGPIAGLPNMYEPSWGPPGKLLSAVAEGMGALLALAGLGWALAMRRRGTRGAHAAGAARAAYAADAARAAQEAQVTQASAEDGEHPGSAVKAARPAPLPRRRPAGRGPGSSP